MPLKKGTSQKTISKTISESFQFFFETRDKDANDLKKMIKDPDPERVREYGGTKYVDMLKQKLKKAESSSEDEQNKAKITARKHEGDDAYSWAVFKDGKVAYAGLHKSEVPHYKKLASGGKGSPKVPGEEEQSVRKNKQGMMGAKTRVFPNKKKEYSKKAARKKYMKASDF